jgi:hypothetical protein
VFFCLFFKITRTFVKFQVDVISKNMATKYPRNFNNWTTQMAHDAFGLTFKSHLSSLTDWLTTVTEPLSVSDKQFLDKTLVKAKERASFWSEGDIKLKLIGPMLVVADIDNDKFSTFSEIGLKATLKTLEDEYINVSGRPDLMIATGSFSAKQPYFCMQEYKPKKKGSDPRGQTLIALMAARQLNIEGNSPQEVLYGAFSVGRDWTFMTVEGSNYAVSQGFLLDKEADIYDVVGRLRVLRNIIDKNIDAPKPKNKVKV